MAHFIRLRGCTAMPGSEPIRDILALVIILAVMVALAFAAVGVIFR